MSLKMDKIIEYHKKYGISNIISAFLVQFYLFPLFMMANIIPFLISYLYHLDKNDSMDNSSEIRQIDGYFIHPELSLLMSIFCFFGGLIEFYLGPRISVILGFIALILGDIAYIFIRKIIVCYFINISLAIGFAISINVSLKNATNFFPDKRGLVSSIANGVGGNLGSLVFNLLIKFVISKGDSPDPKDNYMYNESTAKNYKCFFFIHLVTSALFGIISVLLYIPYKKLDEINEENNKNKIDKIKYKNELFYILKHKRIYYILIIFFFTNFIQGFIMTVGFNFGTMEHKNSKSNITPDEMSLIFMASSFFCIFSGILFGKLFDIYNFKITLFIINIISIINGSTIYFTARWNVIVYGISIIIASFLNGGTCALMFPYVSKIFPFEYSAILYGIIALSTGSGAMLSAIIFYCINNILIDKIINHELPYLIIFLLGVALNIIAIILIKFESKNSFQMPDEFNENFLEENDILTDSDSESNIIKNETL